MWHSRVTCLKKFAMSYYLPVLQLTAYYRSLAKGLNPDKPQNLTAVVHLDLV